MRKVVFRVALLFIIVSAGILLLGYAVMRQIDGFAAGGGFADSPPCGSSAGILVYGSPRDVEKLRKRGIRCTDASDDPILSREGVYAAFFALSEDDAENLRLCRRLKAADPGIFIIARCNLPQLREVFSDVGANRILLPGEQLDGMLNELRVIQS